MKFEKKRDNYESYTDFANCFIGTIGLFQYHD